jgi:hypothetical protein
MNFSPSTPNKSKKFASIMVYVLALFGLAFVVYFGGDVLRDFGNLRGKAALTADNLYETAEVYVNGVLVGETPFESSDIRAGENTVTLKTANRQYDTVINFLPNSHVSVRRDLGASENFSAGQVFWIEKSTAQTVLSITSEPSNASVYIDNTEIGKTPFSTDNLTPGEYDFRIELPGHEAQSNRIGITKGYNLNISIKLFPTPIPVKVDLFEGSEDLYDLSSDNSLVTSDTQNWAKAVVHWNSSRGINLAGVGVNREPIFGYFVDYKGDLYNQRGELVVTPEQYEALAGAGKGGYLGRTSDGIGLTPLARDTYESLKNAVFLGGTTARIKETGTGWLRVRDAAGLTGTEIARVDVGETYPILEDTTDWVKIKISDEVEGWVSKTYIDIL